MTSILERAIGHFESRPQLSIEVGEWNTTVFFRTPNAATLSKVHRESRGDPIEAAARLVAHCAMHEGGEHMFKPLDYKDLMIRTDPSVISRIATAIMAEARLDVDAAEKN